MIKLITMVRKETDKELFIWPYPKNHEIHPYDVFPDNCRVFSHPMHCETRCLIYVTKFQSVYLKLRQQMVPHPAKFRLIYSKKWDYAQTICRCFWNNWKVVSTSFFPTSNITLWFLIFASLGLKSQSWQLTLLHLFTPNILTSPKNTNSCGFIFFWKGIFLFRREMHKEKIGWHPLWTKFLYNLRAGGVTRLRKKNAVYKLKS